MPTVILAFFFGQSRIFFAMAREGCCRASLARRVEPRHAGPHHIFTAVVDVGLRRA